MNNRSPVPAILYGLVALFFLAFFILPVFDTLKSAFLDPNGGLTFGYIWAVFSNELYRDGLVNALKMGFFSTVLSVLIAMPLAVVADRYKFPGKRLLTSSILLPLVLPPFVGAIGIRQILGPQGALNTFLSYIGLADLDAPTDWLGTNRLGGIVLMNALHLYPIVYLNIAAALANLDPALDEAAENLGTSTWRRFYRITLPLVAPGIFAGSTIVFIWSFTELGVPLIFDYTRVTPVQIFASLKDIGGNPLPYALVTVTLITTLILFALGKYIMRRTPTGAGGGRASTAAIERTFAKPWMWWAATGAFTFVTLAAITPHIGVLLTAFAGDWYRSVLPNELVWENVSAALGHEITLPSIQNSLKYASAATVIDLFLGVAIAYLVTRTKLPGRGILDSLAMLPLAVPGLVLAFGYLSMSREGGMFHWMLPGGENPVFLLIIAYAVRRLPYVVRSATAGFQQTSSSLEEAAQNLGATPLRALRKITLPLIAANLIAGGMLAFAFAMLEVSDSLILAQQQEHYPITKAIYGLFRTLGNGEQLAAALGSWAMIFLGVTILGAGLLLGKKLGALFRV